MLKVSHELVKIVLIASCSPRTESSRPFISGQVAHAMASEVISLLHGLLASSASETAKIWASAVRDVLCEVLDYVPDLMRTLETEGRVLLRGDKQATEEQEPDEDGQLSNEHDWFLKARNVMASLCALGGFRHSVHSGCAVQVTRLLCTKSPSIQWQTLNAN